MKYLVIKNLCLMKEKIYKYVLLLLLVIILFLALELKIIPELEIDAIKVFLGLNKLNIDNFIAVIIKFVSYLTIIYVTAKIYLYNIEFSMEYILLRMKKSKLIFFNIVNVIAISSLIRLIVLLIVGGVFYYLNNISISYLIKIIFCDLLLYINLSVLTMLLLNVIYGKNIIFKILILSLIIYSFFINISEYLMILPLLLFLIIILNFVTFKPSLLYSNK